MNSSSILIFIRFLKFFTTRGSLGGPSGSFETGERVQVRHVDEATNQEVWLNGNITEIVHFNQEGGGSTPKYRVLFPDLGSGKESRIVLLEDLQRRASTTYVPGPNIVPKKNKSAVDVAPKPKGATKVNKPPAADASVSEGINIKVFSLPKDKSNQQDDVVSKVLSKPMITQEADLK